jgi:hypothetical protein
LPIDDTHKNLTLAQAKMAARIRIIQAEKLGKQPTLQVEGAVEAAREVGAAISRAQVSTVQKIFLSLAVVQRSTLRQIVRS